MILIILCHFGIFFQNKQINLELKPVELGDKDLVSQLPTGLK